METRFTLTPEDFKKLVKTLNEMATDNNFNGFQDKFGDLWINVHKDLDRSKEITFIVDNTKREDYVH